MVNGIKSNDREKQKRLVNFYVGFIFIKENDLQTGQSRKNKGKKPAERFAAERRTLVNRPLCL